MALTEKKVKVRRLMRFLGIVFTMMFLGFSYWFLATRPPVFLQKIIKPSAGLPPKFLGNILGGFNGTLSKPLDVVANSKGKVYVADSNNDRIQVFSPTGAPLFDFGSTGTGMGEFTYPNCLAVDENDDIYVGEFKNNRIQVFTSAGKYLRSIKSPKNLLLEPLAMTFWKNNRLYVANRNGAIIVMDRSGNIFTTIGTGKSQKEHMSYPNGIAVDLYGNIIVSDSGNDRLMVFNGLGTLIKTIAQPDIKVAVPRGITIDDKNRIYIVDIFGHKVVVYDSDFKFLFEFGKRGLENGQLNFPNGIQYNDNKVYVTDRENNRIVVFTY